MYINAFCEDEHKKVNSLVEKIEKSMPRLLGMKRKASLLKSLNLSSIIPPSASCLLPSVSFILFSHSHYNFARTFKRCTSMCS